MAAASSEAEAAEMVLPALETSEAAPVGSRFALTPLDWTTPGKDDVYYRGPRRRTPRKFSVRPFDDGNTIWSFECPDPTSGDSIFMGIMERTIRYTSEKFGKLFLFQAEMELGRREYGATGTIPFYNMMIASLKAFYAGTSRAIPSFYEVCSAYQGSQIVRFGIDFDLPRADAVAMLLNLGVPEDATNFQADIVLSEAVCEIVEELLTELIEPLIPGMRIERHTARASTQQKVSMHFVFDIYGPDGKLYFMESIKALYDFHEQVIEGRFLHCQACGTRYTVLECSNPECVVYGRPDVIPPGIYIAQNGRYKGQPVTAIDKAIYHEHGLMRTTGPKAKYAGNRDTVLMPLRRDADGVPRESHPDEWPDYDEWTATLMSYLPPSTAVGGVLHFIPQAIIRAGPAACRAYRNRPARNGRTVEQRESGMRKIPGLIEFYNWFIKVDPELTGRFKRATPDGRQVWLESNSRACSLAGVVHGSSRIGWWVDLRPGFGPVYYQHCFSPKRPVCKTGPDNRRPACYVGDSEIEFDIRERIQVDEVVPADADADDYFTGAFKRGADGRVPGFVADQSLAGHLVAPDTILTDSSFDPTWAGPHTGVLEVTAAVLPPEPPMLVPTPPAMIIRNYQDGAIRFRLLPPREEGTGQIVPGAVLSVPGISHPPIIDADIMAQFAGY